MSMFAKTLRFSAFTTSLLLALPQASAAPPSKEECVEAHGKGQDAQEGGQLSLAQRLFLSCAQSACPALVQGECARLVDEVQKLQPTVTFAARDGAQNDLPDTAVLVDGTQVAARLGEGKTCESESRASRRALRARGEDGRARGGDRSGREGAQPGGQFCVSGLAHLPALARTAARRAEGACRRRSGDRAPVGPLVLVGLGAATAVAGGVLLGVGLAKVPANCSVWTHECAAPPDDPVFEKASSDMTLVNLGVIMGGAGAATLTGSLIWYFAQPRRAVTPAPSKPVAVTPWFGGRGGGVMVSGAL